MTWRRLADRKIREAMNAGQFDGLAREGAIDLDEYFKLPVELRLAYSILKNAGIVPEEVEMLREIDQLQTSLAEAVDERTRQSLTSALTQARLRLDLALERGKRRRNGANS